jgi:hypothetical protein
MDIVGKLLTIVSARVKGSMDGRTGGFRNAVASAIWKALFIKVTTEGYVQSCLGSFLWFDSPRSTHTGGSGWNHPPAFVLERLGCVPTLPATCSHRLAGSRSVRLLRVDIMGMDLKLFH